jgi:hypothetical protein
MADREPDVEYEYRPRPFAAIALIALFGPITVLLAVLALKARPGSDAGAIPMSPGAATAAAWAMCAFSGLFVVLGVVVAVRRATLRQRLVLGATGMTVPASPWTRKERTIAYEDIRWLGEHDMYRQRMLTVDHAGGSLTIAASMLPSGLAYDAIVERLRARAPKSLR